MVRYFTEEQEADRVMVQNTTQDALALAGVWSDLEWDELEQALESIHTNPTQLHHFQCRK